jgi:hypothetical protein
MNTVLAKDISYKNLQLTVHLANTWLTPMVFRGRQRWRQCWPMLFWGGQSIALILGTVEDWRGNVGMSFMGHVSADSVLLALGRHFKVTDFTKLRFPKSLNINQVVKFYKRQTLYMLVCVSGGTHFLIPLPRHNASGIHFSHCPHVIASEQKKQIKILICSVCYCDVIRH